MKNFISKIGKSRIKKVIISSFSPNSVGFKKPDSKQGNNEITYYFYENYNLLYFDISDKHFHHEKTIVRHLIDEKIDNIIFLNNGIEVVASNYKGYLISDHINMSGENPLQGINEDAYGPRFPDMTSTYETPFSEEQLIKFGLNQSILLIPSNIDQLSELEKRILKNYDTVRIYSDKSYSGVITAKHAGLSVTSIILKKTMPIKELLIS